MVNVKPEVLNIASWPEPVIDLVRVCDLSGQSPNAELAQLSRGTVKALNIRTNAGPYTPDAYIPNEPWERLSDILAGHLFTKKTPEHPRCGVISIDRDVLEALPKITELYPPERTERWEVSRMRFKPLLNYIETRFEPKEETIEHGAVWDKPGLETVTINRESHKYLGLHLDSWDGLSYEERRASRTRICVNLGPEARSFIFVPIRLEDLATALATMKPIDYKRGPHELLPIIFEVFQSVPAIRLNIQPGMAYFADTDNILHDGSSGIASVPSLHYTVRGRFRYFD